MTPSPELAALAEAHGVATRYVDQAGTEQQVGADTVVAVLGALGVVAGDAAAVRHALEEHRLAHWRRTLPPTLVTRSGTATTSWVHVPVGDAVALMVDLEDGGRLELQHAAHPGDAAGPVLVDGTAVAEVRFVVPPGLPTGWHLLRARLASGAEPTCPLVVTPARLELPAAVAGRRGWGFALQLYALRSRRSWGIGDLADLTDLAQWSGCELGADFVQVNPLHAAAPVPPLEPSPYLPVSRRFANPSYLRVEAIPEYAYLPVPSQERVAALAAGPLAAARTSELLDRDASWEAKRAALQLVHGVPLSPGRAASYRAYCRREGLGLDDFATWCALVEEHGPMQEWPDGLLDPRSDEVARERERLAAGVEFHQWCQWVLDDQLAQAQGAARAAGMAIGVLHDLAVGVHPKGADAWSQQAVMAQGVTVGAPPDMYTQQGQDWSQPPWRPAALADAGYAPYRELLRTVLRHAGGIRVDHILGLFRLWWIPEGSSPAEGTYVRYDHDAMLGILALEAQRCGAVVVGEDLGTVEKWVQDELADRGILGTSILWFGRAADGSVPPSAAGRTEVLASVTTHDLPPTAAYLRGDHVRLREQLGLLVQPAAQEWSAHERELAAWSRRLRAEGLLPAGAGEAATVEALHAYLGRTPARLVAVSLADAVGDLRTQNQPGTHREYPNWQVPLTDGEGRAVLLEQLPTLGRLAELVRTLLPD